MFNGYFNQKRCLLGFTGRKLRQIARLHRSTSLGVCLHNDVWMKPPAAG